MYEITSLGHSYLVHAVDDPVAVPVYLVARFRCAAAYRSWALRGSPMRVLFLAEVHVVGVGRS